MKQKNSLLVLFLSAIPGVGHLYLNRKRGAFYLMVFLGDLILGLGVTVLSNSDEPLIVASILAAIIWVINLFDIFIILVNRRTSLPANGEVTNEVTKSDQERFYTILLSFIPGLGHFQLGLMNRGLTLLIGFFGLATMILFVTSVTNQGGFIVFLLILPVIWIYSFFDSMQQLSRKEKGAELVDRTVLEDLDISREDGKKSKVIATVLSVFPGAGHMYIGLQRRGIQLMAIFLFSIYILDVLRLSAFLFFIPLIWFYSFFDALQNVSKYGEEEVEDIPIVSYLINHQKWLGIGLLVLGGFYLVDEIVIPVFAATFSNMLGIDLSYWYNRFFQTFIVSILMIGGGFKLLIGSKRKKEGAK